MSTKNTISAIEDFLIVEGDKPKKAALLMVFGGYDLKLSDHAARLLKRGYCDYIIVSGGANTKLKDTTEARWHSENLTKKGVPPEKIILEDRANNSLENVRFSRKVILKKFRKLPKRIIVVCKAFHGRRVLMTLRKNLSKDIEYILQPVQTKRHHIKTWWRKQSSKNHILDELRKIGEYALKGDITYD